MYAKIFRQIYEGTLCTKGPWQALVTFQQFLILADQFGVVDMTPEAIARITTVPQEIINVGISALEQEDSGSRNGAENGRRISRLRDHTAWGWQIVNYDVFAKLRSAQDRREYQREYKRRLRGSGKKSTSVNNVNNLSKNVNASTPQTQTQTHKTPLASDEADPDGFSLFWEHYPRKEKRKAAVQAWRKLKPGYDTQVVIRDALARAIRSEQWTKNGGEFIPHAASWINGERWKDQPTQAPAESRMGKFVI